MNYTKFTVIIPTLNEGKNIGKLLKILNSKYHKLRIIVSDDGSKDNTKKESLKHKHVKFLDRSKKSVKGLTASVIDGILNVKTEYFIVMDGDLQHPPEKIKDIANYLSKGSEIVAGARKKVLVPWAWHRKMGSKVMTVLGKTRLLFNGVKCHDIMSGFFGMKTKLAKEIYNSNKNSFQMEGYKILFDLLKNTKSIKVKDVFYSFGQRKGGESKLGAKVTFEYLKSLFT